MERFPSSAVVRACAVGVLAVLVLPPAATAQQDVFANALLEFGTAVAGRNGDERPQIAASLDRMTVGLAAWDRALATIEANLRAGLARAAPAEAVQARLNLVRLYLPRGRRSDALIELDAAIALEPDRVDLYLLRGLVREATGAREEALEDFRLAWSVDRRDPVAAYLVANRSLSLDEAADVQPQIDALTTAQEAGIRPRTDSVFSGLALLEDDMAPVPVFVPAAYTSGFALVSEGRYREAIASFREAAARDPLVVDRAADLPSLRRGVASLRLGAVQEAREALEAVVAESADSSEARRFLGLAYRAEGRPDDAVAALQQAVELAPSDDRARVTLARVLVEQERREDAERLLLETIDLLPQAAEAHWVLSFLYDERNRIEDAARVLDAAAALALPEGRGEIYVRKAWLYDLSHDYEGAAVALDARARENPRAPDAYLQLGLAAWRSGDHRRSLLALLLTSVLDPDNAECLAAIGQIHLDAGRLRAAEAALRRAVALAPGREQARFALGRTLVLLGQVEEGRAHLAAFADLRRKYREDSRETFTVDTLTAEAETRMAEGRFGQAATLWQQVVDLEPESAGHRVALADALMAGGDPDSALGHLEAAAKIAADPDVYRRLVILYRRLGRTEDAAAAEAALVRLR